VGFKRIAINRFGLHVNRGCIEVITIKINDLLCILNYIQQFSKPIVVEIRRMLMVSPLCINLKHIWLSCRLLWKIMSEIKRVASWTKESEYFSNFMTGYGLDHQIIWFQFPTGHHSVQTVFEAHSLLYIGVSQVLSPGWKGRGNEADHSSPYNAEVENTSTSGIPLMLS
jgi:hypothetical protein